MNRRAFISLVGGGAASSVVWPLAATAQQSLPVIGFLNQESEELIGHSVAGFRKGLRETGFVEGRNAEIEFRWAEGRYEQLPRLAGDLVNRKVAVITASYLPAALAAKAATTTIPIVFISGVDPVAAGLVSSLRQPGGNLTGLSNFNTSLTAKRLELLHEVVPHAGAIAVLANPRSPTVETVRLEAQAASRALKLPVDVVAAATQSEIDVAVADAVRRGAGALVVAGDAFFNSRRQQLIALAARHRLPALYDRKEIAVAGGLMSYGISNFDQYRQIGIYTGQILKGAKPADLPVQQPTKVELIVNLQVARSLGLEMPTSVLLSADEVIE
jgi:ABC-type uncharacterized transport system substrate-binding protein